MVLERVRAVVADLDDTLTQTWRIKWAHHKAVAQRMYGIELTDEVLAEHWGKPFDEMIRYLYQDADSVENMRAANRSLEAEFLKRAQPGACEVIRALRLGGMMLAVVTSTNQSFAEQDMSRLGFNLADFVAIQGAEATQAHKPDPAVFAPVLGELATLGIDVAETIYVGDALMDYYAARDARLGFVGVTTGRTTSEAFHSAGAEYVIDSIQGLLPLVGVVEGQYT